MNYNFELIEIMHLASQAIMSDDDTVKRIAIGDIYHVAKSAIRGTSGAAGVRALPLPGCPSLMPAKVIPHDEPAAEPRSREEVEVEKQRQRMLKQAFHKRETSAAGKVMA